MKSLPLLLFLFLWQFSFAQVTFYDVTNTAGIANTGEKNHGITVVDFDQDGDQDLFFLTRTGANQLHENLGNGFFKEVGSRCGLGGLTNTRAAAWGDFNNDSWPDLYLGNYQTPDEIWMNLGPDENSQVHFSNRTDLAGINNLNEPRSVNLADINLDGLLDIYVSNYSSENVLWLNQGGFRFKNGTNDSGLSGPGFSMGSIFFDYDQDGDPDLYLTHDFLEPNRLYQNDGNGHYIDVAPQLGLDIAAHGMGVDVADVNNDGWLDIYLTDLNENFLLVRQPDGRFLDESPTLGTGDAGMGWSTCFVDADMNGLMDLYVINDSRFSPFPNRLYLQEPSQVFSPIDYRSPLCSSGSGVGGTYADINLDGFPDFIVANSFPLDGNELFLNKGNQNHWIGLNLQGSKTNRDAIGTRVLLEYGDGKVQTREVVAGSGYASQYDKTLFLGLGEYHEIGQVSIFWPGGETQIISNLEIDSIHSVVEPAGKESRSTVSLFPIAPNPVQHKITLRLQAEESGQLQGIVRGIEGKTILTFDHQIIDPGFTSISLDLPDLSSGFYTLQISLNDSHWVNRTFICY